MSAPNPAGVEALLALLYVDAEARRRFLQDARGEAERFGLRADDLEQLSALDRDGLLLFAQSIEHKRRKPAQRAWYERLWIRIGR